MGWLAVPPVPSMVWASLTLWPLARKCQIWTFQKATCQGPSSSYQQHYSHSSYSNNAAGMCLSATCGMHHQMFARAAMAAIVATVALQWDFVLTFRPLMVTVVVVLMVCSTLLL